MAILYKKPRKAQIGLQTAENTISGDAYNVNQMNAYYPKHMTWMRGGGRQGMGDHTKSPYYQHLQDNAIYKDMTGSFEDHNYNAQNTKPGYFDNYFNDAYLKNVESKRQGTSDVPTMPAATIQPEATNAAGRFRVGTPTKQNNNKILPFGG